MTARLMLSCCFLCWLLMMCSSFLAANAQQQHQQQQQQQRRRRRRPLVTKTMDEADKEDFPFQKPQEGQQTPSWKKINHPYTQHDTDHFHLYQDQQQQQTTTTTDVAYDSFWQNGLNQPKHVLEGVKNIFLISVPLAMVGTASMVGIPLLVAYQLLVSSARIPGGPTGSSAVIVTTAAALAGGLFGATCWVTSLVFGIRQLLIGSIHTPTALWAKLQQRTYYHPQERRWKKYYLQEHSQELNNNNRQAYYYYQQNPPRRSLPDTSLYEILQIQPTATTKEVKRAYYDLAKMVHPDRRNQTRSSNQLDPNNNNNNNRDDFLKIHAAYEVLSNPRTRRDYDMLGIKTTKQERLNKTFQFDAGIFFDLLFGVSTELEQYVGELNIKSIAFRLYEGATIAMMLDDERSKKTKNDDDKKKEEEGNDTFWDRLSIFFLEEINHDRELRQVEVALFLQDFVSDYAIHGTLTETAFEDKCQKAARAVIASTPPLFGRQFASSIGTTLYWLGHSYLHSPFGIPMFLAARTRSTYKNMERWTTMMHGFVKFAREVRDVVDGVRRTEANKNSDDGESPPPSTKDEITQRIQQKLVQEMAAPLMALLWEYNQWDIASTLEGAYWKVINDSGGGSDEGGSNKKMSWQQRSRQAQAIRMLGNAFLQQSTSNNDNSRHAPGQQQQQQHQPRSTREMFLDVHDRVKFAFQMATAANQHNDDEGTKPKTPTAFFT
eukprot:scaffold3788_cov72-Cylindrotheca_fusiformis.AAC.3